MCFKALKIMSHLTFYMGIKKKVMSRIHQFRIGDNVFFCFNLSTVTKALTVTTVKKTMPMKIE